MAEKKEKLVQGVSPLGKASFAYLTKPDEYKGAKFYKTYLVLTPGPEQEKFCDMLEEHAQKVFDEGLQELKPAKRKTMELHVPFGPELDGEGEETGNIAVFFKSTYKPKLFDAAGTLIKKDIVVGSGSLIHVAYGINPFFATGLKKGGVNLYLNAVQIKELAEFGASAESYGFSTDGEGFSAGDSFDDYDDGEGRNPDHNDDAVQF